MERLCSGFVVFFGLFSEEICQFLHLKDYPLGWC